MEEPTAFGDSELLESLFSSNSGSRPKAHGEFLSTGRTLSIRKERLRALALNEASVARLLARIGMEQAIDRALTLGRATVE